MVTSTGDSGAGTLRQAILDANAAGSPPNRIVFAVPASDPGFDGTVFTIAPVSALPIVRSGVAIDGSTQTTFTGDTNTAGPEVVVSGAGAAGGNGIEISGDGSAVSGLVVNGFAAGGGIAITRSLDTTSSNNRIVGNYIGTNARGTAAVPNRGGVFVGGFGSPGVEARDNLVAGNLIAGNAGDAMGFCDTLRTTIVNNLVGTTRTGLGALGNTGNGINLQCGGDPSFTIEDNTIAYNGGDGYLDQPDYRFSSTLHDHNALRRNLIHSNGGIGINLSPPPFGTLDGPTANDHCDSDVGGNALQNYPQITTVSLAGAGTTITGTLDSVPQQSFSVELYASDVADPSGFGEGERYLGTTTVLTDAGCTGGFSVTVPVDVLPGQVVSATAIDSTGNTSEFSRAVKPVNQPPTALYTASTFTPQLGQTVTFNGSASTDPDGTIVDYRWVWGDGTPDGFGAIATHAFATAGTRSVVLYVTDNNGQIASVAHGVTASGDEVPIAAYTPSTYTPTVGQTVTFDASASNDPDGTIAAYRWVWGDGTPDGTGRIATHAFAAAGRLSVGLYITDSDGQTAATGHGITVSGATAAPRAAARHPGCASSATRRAATRPVKARARTQTRSVRQEGCAAAKSRRPARRHGRRR